MLLAVPIEQASPHSSLAQPDSVVELRQYTLHPGARDTLIDLFDRELVETQEAVGMRVIGQFRDLDDLDRFVWLRGFRDMHRRAAALEAFYDGPVWRRHRAAANATMIASDDVLLLRPARPGSGFGLDTTPRPSVGASRSGAGMVTATICYLEASAGDRFLGFFENEVAPKLAAAGGPVLAYFVTEPSRNTFPRLPVREGENVFVWFTGFSRPNAHGEHLAALERLSPRLSEQLAARLKRGPEVLRLSPTPRSRLTGTVGQPVLAYDPI